MARRRWNQPSLFTSKTRSNSRGSLSGRKWLRSMPAACSSTSMRPLPVAHFVDDLGHAVPVGEVDAQVVRRAAGGSHRVDRAPGGLRPFQGRQFLFHQRRSGAIAASLYARKQIALQAVLVTHEALEVRIVGTRFGHKVKQVDALSDEISGPLRSILNRQGNIEVLLDESHGINGRE